MGRVANILAVALTCGIVALAADFFRRVGLALHAEQYLAGLLAIAMPLLFLHVPADGGRKGRVGPIPWYDLAAAVVSCACAAYTAVRYPALSDLVSVRPWDGLLVAAALDVLLLEGLRRTTGLALVIVA